MEVINRIPPVTSYLEVKLDQVIIDYLWELIEISRTTSIDYKSTLAGNISNSYLLKDEGNFFYKNVCIPLIKKFRQQNQGFDPIQVNTFFDRETPLLLREIWVNYQYKTEFNPYHDHAGVYSFVIWMKIPYCWEEEDQISQLNGVKEGEKRPGNFEFEYIDTLGTIRTIQYRLSPSLEATMLFFPAKLRHCVYPFFSTDEPRISIAGNLAFDNTVLT